MCFVEPKGWLNRIFCICNGPTEGPPTLSVITALLVLLKAKLFQKEVLN